MRPALLAATAVALIVLGAASAALTGPDDPRTDGGLSLRALSRCAGIAGSEIRAADPAFGLLMLDGAPWMTLQVDGESVLLAGSGALRRRNGAIVPFRFSCLLDERGRALMFRVAVIGPGSEPLAPAHPATGTAALDTGDPLPRGAELRIQLVDTTTAGAHVVLAEQLVRSGWETPIPFALRVPADTRLDGRTLVLAARVTVARKTVFAMAPRAVTAEDLRRPLALTLTAAGR